MIFTEHRDTLSYLYDNIANRLLGRSEAVAVIHGGLGREDRQKAQERFLHDTEVQILLATDAASEGINLQRAHLMVNYDLPWNPNRIEQRFGRIHRIKQTEICYLFNLVADKTREGDVYRTLLDKIEQAREALGGQVFDVLGKLQFEGKPLRDLLIEAIRYGEQPEVQARLNLAISDAIDRPHLEALMEDSALAPEIMDSSRVASVRENMERAEARRLQPHYIEEFFREAFRRLGGKLSERESRRYQITNVPAPIRDRDRIIGFGEPVLRRYERAVFEKDLISPQGKPLAAFICPGHPLLDATLDLTLERHRDLLRRGAILVDEQDQGTEPRMLFYAEHAIQDSSLLASGERRTISKRMLYVELDAEGNTRHMQYAPYLDYRPLREDEPGVEAFLVREECGWITRELEQQAMGHLISEVAPEHLAEVRGRRVRWIDKTRDAVKDRLIKEINHWDYRAAQLEEQEAAGKVNARLNAQEARRRADDLQGRLRKRLEELERESEIRAAPPVVIGGLMVVPAGLIAEMTGGQVPSQTTDTQAVAAEARKIVMEVERKLGFQPVDREFEHLGYDIESRDRSGKHGTRMIEVKGRRAGADTVTMTKNEILTSLNSHVPASMLLSIGIEPQFARRIWLADESSIRRPVGAAKYGLLGDEYVGEVIFSEEGTQPILGLTVLESLGLVVDPQGERILPRSAIRV